MGSNKNLNYLGMESNDQTGKVDDVEFAEEEENEKKKADLSICLEC